MATNRNEKPSSATTSTAATTSAATSSLEEESLSDHDETINIDDPFIFNTENDQNVDRNETDINEIDWTQAQGITPDSHLAWALDGHIRVRSVMNPQIPLTGLVSSVVVVIVREAFWNAEVIFSVVLMF